MSATLVSLDGPLKGEAFPVGDDECSVGRDSGNTIQIPEAAVSRRHCTIRSQADGVFMLTDLASRNGTMRNGFPVTQCLLRNGDEISVGPFHFLFLADPVEGSPPQAR